MENLFKKEFLKTQKNLKIYLQKFTKIYNYFKLKKKFNKIKSILSKLFQIITVVKIKKLIY